MDFREIFNKFSDNYLEKVVPVYDVIRKNCQVLLKGGFGPGETVEKGKLIPKIQRRVFLSKIGAADADLTPARKRELRRMLGKVKLKVQHLVRTAIGPLQLQGLPPGRYRRLSEKELGFARERMKEGWKPKPVPDPPREPPYRHPKEHPAGRGPRRRSDRRS